MSVVHLPIPGATLRRLEWHADARGALVELFRESWEGGRADADPDGSPLGAARQVYLSETMPGVVKGWHRHARQVDRFTCLRGRVLVALVDGRPGAAGLEVVEVVLDPDRALAQLTIPPGVWHGWLGSGSGRAAVLNCVSREYAPPGSPDCDEERSPPDAPLWPGFRYDWRRRRDG